MVALLLAATTSAPSSLSVLETLLWLQGARTTVSLSCKRYDKIRSQKERAREECLGQEQGLPLEEEARRRASKEISHRDVLALYLAYAPLGAPYSSSSPASSSAVAYVDARE